MEFSSRKIVIAAVKDYAICRCVDYQVYEILNILCQIYTIRHNMIRKKYCSEIRRYNDIHTCIRATIFQDHSKLSSITIVEAKSNFLRKFKAPYQQNLIVNIGYSRTVRKHQLRYKHLRKRGETYTSELLTQTYQQTRLTQTTTIYDTSHTSQWKLDHSNYLYQTRTVVSSRLFRGCCVVVGMEVLSCSRDKGIGKLNENMVNDLNDFKS
ncbi:hypothetical protein Ahy_B05g075887 [Arachis hypogaea]|uniref:Uncharacterized protein n=1 Tax=Arachis hypogaea TaxID=3818 RepID=A0A444Z2J2_ARAHY|nr:hypothetical protein Ahy_B05g075887 [Arachis hypogaea]